MEKQMPFLVNSTVNLNISPELEAALKADGISSLQGYIPGYGGESAALDLYNAGPDLVIKPAASTSNSVEMFEATSVDNYLTWLDSVTSLHKAAFKCLLPTGLRVRIPLGYVGLIKERGSITKTPLVVRAGVIDPGYSGEVFVNMVNVSNSEYTIAAGAKTPFQLLITVANTEFEIVGDETFEQLHADSARKANMIGSTG